MVTREKSLRELLTTFFPMFIAALSLVTSIYNGYLNHRFVDLIENNVSRVEYMRTCKEIIDAYLQVKVRTGGLSAIGDGQSRGDGRLQVSRDPAGAAEAVARFAALGTWLANLRDEAIRERYTRLTWSLERAVSAAGTTPPGELAILLGAADSEFAVLNDDCVRAAKAQRL